MPGITLFVWKEEERRCLRKGPEAIGIAVRVSILAAKQNTYLTTIANEPTHAVATGSSLVFQISLLLAVINVALTLFIKKPT